MPGELDLVTVLEVRDSVALNLAKTMLEEAGLPYLIVEQGPRLPTGIWGAPGVASELGSSWATLIQVSRELEPAAAEILAPLRNPEP